MTADHVDVWRIPLGAHPTSQRRAHARQAARRVLADYLGVTPEEVRWSAGRWGKPELDHAIRFNLSHAGDFALLAVSDVADVGVDIERRLPRPGAQAVADRFFGPADRALLTAAADRQDAVYLRLWTRKEACVKAAGGRLFDGLALPVGIEDGTLVHDPTGRLGGPWTVGHVPAPAGYVASVALVGARALVVVPRTWRDRAPPGPPVVRAARVRAVRPGPS